MTKETELVNKLTKKKYTITTAESCTGGLLSGAIVNVDGASGVFRCGFVTYANEAKEKYARVASETIQKYGAVSEETAAQMALGCAKEADADIGLATTGIAGPGGGTPEKPVGLVYIACAIHGKVTVERHLFSGDRSRVRGEAVKSALDLAIHCLGME